MVVRARVEEVLRAENLAMRVAEMGEGAEGILGGVAEEKAWAGEVATRLERAVEVQDRMVVAREQEATVQEKSAAGAPEEGRDLVVEAPAAA